VSELKIGKLLLLMSLLLFSSSIIVVSGVEVTEGRKNNGKIVVLWYSGKGGEGINEIDAEYISLEKWKMGDYSELISTWTSMGVEVREKRSGTITREDLIGVNVLLVSSPREEFSGDEVKTILEFLEKGGGLILLSDYWNEGVATLSEKLGVMMNGDLIIDPNLEHCYLTHYTPFLVLSKTPGERPHPLMEGVERVAVFEASSLRSISGESREIAWGGIDSYSDENRNFGFDEWEKMGGIPVMATSKIGRGRAFLSGDGDLFRDLPMRDKTLDNRKLAENILLWVTGVIEPEEEVEERETKVCVEGPVGERRCSEDGKYVLEKYVFENCTETWREIKKCLISCSDGVCFEERYGGLFVLPMLLVSILLIGLAAWSLVSNRRRKREVEETWVDEEQREFSETSVVSSK